MHGATVHAFRRRPKNSRAAGRGANLLSSGLTHQTNGHIFWCVDFFAGETGESRAGAEGETAPETLRQKDRLKD